MENGHVLPSECPPQAELAEFVTGNLPGKVFERIATWRSERLQGMG